MTLLCIALLAGWGLDSLRERSRALTATVVLVGLLPVLSRDWRAPARFRWVRP